MDYRKAYVGDLILYQGNTCANTVTNGETYEVVEVVPGKPLHFFIISDGGVRKLCKMGFMFAKIGGI